MEDQQEMLRSQQSDQRAYVRFINWTHRAIDLVWIGFDGLYVRYRKIEHEQFVDINTFKGHPWIALDSITKDRMHIDNNFTYHPKTTKEFFESRSRANLPENYEARFRAAITIPVYSLKYRVLLALRDLFTKLEDIEQLELPESLKDELKRVIRCKVEQKMTRIHDHQPRGEA